MLLLRFAPLVWKLVVQVPARTKSELVETVPLSSTCVIRESFNSSVISVHCPVRKSLYRMAVSMSLFRQTVAKSGYLPAICLNISHLRLRFH